MPPASFTRLKTDSMPALMLTPQLATAPARSRPAPMSTSLSVTPSSAQMGAPGLRVRRPTRAARIRERFMGPSFRVRRRSCVLPMPEIRPTHVVVSQELSTVTLERDRPGLQHVAVVGDGQRLVGILLDEQDGGPAQVDLADDAEDLLHEQGGQAQRGLVEAVSYTHLTL